MLLALGVSLGVHAFVLSSLSEGQAGRAGGSGSAPIKVRLLATPADVPALGFPQEASAESNSAAAALERAERPPERVALHAGRMTQPGTIAEQPVSVAKASPRSAATPESASGPRIYTVSELDVLPSPAGEPLVDLRDFDDVALDGSVELVLLIDPAGRVIDEQLSGGTGLPIGVVDVLRRSFRGFPYVPGQVAGSAVHSRVRLQIALRDGRASVGMSQ